MRKSTASVLLLGGILLLGAQVSYFDALEEPISVRNNNPCNIKYREVNNWVGSVREDGVFEVFDTAQHGLRACKIVVLANIQATDSVDEFALRFASEPYESLADIHILNYSLELQEALGYSTKIRKCDTYTVMQEVIKLEGGAEAQAYYSRDNKSTKINYKGIHNEK